MARKEVLRCARELASAVEDSAEMHDLQRCEEALGELRERDLADFADDPRVIAYTEAKDRAERLLRQVQSVFLFPLTGSLRRTGAAESGCTGCPLA